MSDELSRISTALGSDSHQNPRWPPLRNNYIAVRRGDYPTLIGVVRHSDPSSLECVIHLLNGMKNKQRSREVANLLRVEEDPENFALVVETDNWNYVRTENVRKLSMYLSRYGYPKLSDDLKGREMVFSRAKDRPVSLHSREYGPEREDPDTALRFTSMFDPNNITGFEFLENDEVFSDMLNMTFRNTEGADIRDMTAERADTFQLRARMIQEEARAIPPESREINPMMAERLVTNNDTLADTAQITMDVIVKDLRMDDESVYNDSLDFRYHDGYLHALRADIPLREEITEDLLADDLLREFRVEFDEEDRRRLIRELPVQSEPDIPSIEFFEWQYGEPIKHNELKAQLSAAEKSARLFREDQKILRDVELILSQEYFIALNPEPRYQLWTFEKLIKLWYADSVLTAEIRMIKMLVNTFRARSDKVYNRENGVKPMIMIYPRYGKRSAMNIVQRLAYWFALHESAISWRNNPPSYYKQMNDLIAYTNSNNEIKLFYRRMFDPEDKGVNNPYADNFTKIRDTAQGDRDILHQYIDM